MGTVLHLYGHENAGGAPARRGSVVIARRELSDRGGEFAAELRALGGRAEADLGVDRERSETGLHLARVKPLQTGSIVPCVV